MSTDWYAPNQQAVGVEPASETAPVVEPTKAATKSKAKSKSEEDDDE